MASSRQAELLLSYVPLSSCMQAKVKAIHNWETTITSESKLAISSCPGCMFANSRHVRLVAGLPDPLAFGSGSGNLAKCYLEGGFRIEGLFFCRSKVKTRLAVDRV